MADSSDLYQVLGLSRSASEDEIRRAYRKLARQYHPDVNPGNTEAENTFKRISAAYDVLSDPARRKLYDEFGEESLQSGFDPEKAREYARWKEARTATGHPFEREAYDFDLGDLGDLFGGIGGAAGARAGRRARVAGEDVRGVVELDFEQAIRGTEVALEVPGPAPCRTCGGDGGAPGTTPQTCGRCGGSGRAQLARGPLRMTSTCPTCGGSGAVRPPCPTCGGAGTVQTTRTVTVRIPKGAADGSTLRIPGKGAPGVGGGPPGDLVVETRVRPHPVVRREGLDLVIDLPVTLAEAYRGAQVEVPTFDGPIRLRVPPRSQSGARLRVRGKGVERGDRRGDLFVVLDVKLPDRPDDDVAEALGRAESAYSRPIREGMRL